MTGMVERVARAMCASMGTIWGGPKGEDDPDFLLTKLTYMSMARAAIAEMRDPTDAMIEGGERIIREAINVINGVSEPADEGGYQIFSGMIDTALQEGKEGE